MNFGDKVRGLMKSRGLTQKTVALSLGTNQPVVSDWVRNDTPPVDRGRLIALARLLGVSVDYLIDDAMETPDAKDLTLDEKTILDVIKALRLSKDEVIRRLYGPPKYGDGGGNGGESDPGAHQGQARLLSSQPGGPHAG